MAGELFVDACAAGLAGALASLDRTAALQVMVSRPLVAAAAVGALLGDVNSGLAAGVLAELLLIGDLPVGGYVPLHETALAVVAAAVSVVLVRSWAPEAAGEEAYGWAAAAWPSLLAAAPAVAAAVPAGVVFRRLDALARRLNGGLVDGALRSAAAGDTAGVVAANLKGTAVFFAVTAPALTAALLLYMYAARSAAGLAAGSPLLDWFAAALFLAASARALDAVCAQRRCLLVFGGGAAAALAWMAAS
ncbi:MAG TPA: hypothetical protein ENJ37_00835 [Deltaproteobacteria bacterium]|nr:hypothetical protein [Deltaproteobacteria bacterium]